MVLIIMAIHLVTHPAINKQAIMNPEGHVGCHWLIKRLNRQRSSSSSSSSSSRHSFNTEDLVSAPNLELGCAVILHNCASDYIQTVLVV